MIVVKNVEVIQADDNKITIRCFSDPSSTYYQPRMGPVSAEDKKVTTEDIKGRQFVNERGEIVIIGWNKDTQDVLGLPFRVFEEYGSKIQEQSRVIEHLREENHRLEGKIQEYVAHSTEKTRYIISIRGMSFWQRLKFLVTGNLPDA